MEQRIVVHGNRIWQMPFSYIGISAIAASLATDSGGALPIHWLFLALALLGGFVLWAMKDASDSYCRTGTAMRIVENELKLERADQKTSTSDLREHSYPHFFICAFAIIILLAGARVFWQA